jgi:hypothetical protein
VHETMCKSKQASADEEFDICIFSLHLEALTEVTHESYFFFLSCMDCCNHSVCQSLGVSMQSWQV